MHRRDVRRACGFRKLHEQPWLIDPFEGPDVRAECERPRATRGQRGAVRVACWCRDAALDHGQESRAFAHLEANVWNRLQRLLEIGHEPIGVGPIDDAMIE